MISKVSLEVILSIHQNQVARTSTTLNFFVDNCKSVGSQYLTPLSLRLKKCFSKRIHSCRIRSEKIRKWKDALHLCSKKRIWKHGQCFNSPLPLDSTALKFELQILQFVRIFSNAAFVLEFQPVFWNNK